MDMDNRQALRDRDDEEPDQETPVPVYDAVFHPPVAPKRRENTFVLALSTLGWVLMAVLLGIYGYFWSLLEKIFNFWRDPY